MNKRFFVGSYAKTNEPGIFTCEFSTDTGRIRVLKETSGVENPTYLTAHPFLPILYSVGADEKGGLIASFRILEDGALELLNRIYVDTVGGCHVSVDEAGEFLAASNYRNADLCILKLGKDGIPEEVTEKIHHTGHSVHPLRQQEAHVHFAAFEGSDVLCCDLGEDTIDRYHLNRENGRLTKADPSYKSAPGDGPRHLVINEENKKIYCITEMGSNVTVLDEKSGEILKRIPSIPEDVDLKSLELLDYDAYGAAIRMTQDGSRVLSSNRGHNSITIFAVEKDGSLTRKSNTLTGGIAPRDFNIEENFVIAAHQVTNDLTVLQFNEDRTELTLTGERLKLPSSPVCVLFA